MRFKFAFLTLALFLLIGFTASAQTDTTNGSYRCSNSCGDANRVIGDNGGWHATAG